MSGRPIGQSQIAGFLFVLGILPWAFTWNFPGTIRAASTVVTQLDGLV